jgi:hypothetical protein
MANFENQRRSLGAPSLSRPPLRGPRGERGPAGPAGAAGASGVTGITPLGTGGQFGTFSRREQNIVYVTDFMTIAEQIVSFACTRTLDLQPAIQKAIDYAMYANGTGVAGGPKVRLPGTVLRIDRPINLGYGTDIRSCILEGDGIRYGGNFGQAGSGTALAKNFNNAPAIVIQGSFFSQVRNLSIFGQNQNQITALINAPVMANLNTSAWIDPSFPASASSQFAIECGVAIDPYSGPQPLVHYPDAVYPAFLGSVSQYNKGVSSNIKIENVLVQGCVAGVALQPCNADGNGDFVRLENVSIFYCTYGFVWGNSQARVTTLDNCSFLGVHTGFTNKTFGTLSGNAQILIRGASFNSMIQIADLDTQNGGGPQFLHCFAESIYKIGKVGTNAQFGNTAVWDDCVFGFSYWEPYGVPTYVYENNARSCMAKFSQCYFFMNKTFGTFDRWGGLSFKIGGAQQLSRQYSFEDCFVVWSDDPTQLWQKCALNATGGVSFSYHGTAVERYGWRSANTWNLDTGASLDAALYGEKNTGARNRCLPAYGKFAKSALNGPTEPGVPVGWRVGGVTAAGAVTQSGRNISFTVTGFTADKATHLGGLVGDVLWSESNGSQFWVYDVTGTTISARAQTGFDASGNLLTAIGSGTNFYGLNCRRYCPGPDVVIYGDLTAASPNITNVVDGTGTALDASSVVTAGDWLAQDHEVDKLFATANFVDPKVNTIVSGQITMNANAVRTATHVRLGLFTRQAVANGTATP